MSSQARTYFLTHRQPCSYSIINMVAEDGGLSENINSFMGVTHSPNPNASAIIFEILNT